MSKVTLLNRIILHTTLYDNWYLGSQLGPFTGNRNIPRIFETVVLWILCRDSNNFIRIANVNDEYCFAEAVNPRENSSTKEVALFLREKEI